MNHRVRGFTLIETVIAIVILSTAGITLIGVMARMAESSAEGLARTQSLSIARSYIDNILGQLNFNDVDDFDGQVHNGARDAYGNVIPELSNYRIAVAVGNVGFDGIGPANARFVSVTVTDPLGRQVLLSGYRTNRP
jgi:MSHA pilin protein MshD